MSNNNNNNCTTCSSSGGDCGTGGWSGPAPGDPNLSDIVLSARNVRGGIDVSWTYPTINPGAVAHTKVYRNTSGNFDTAIQIATSSGSLYFDKVIVEGTYYYWIKMVSIHGTEGDLIGPASAVRMNIRDELTNDLDGSIGESLLDEWLSEKIRDITKTYDELNQEILDRIQYTDALADALAAMGDNFEGAITVVDNRVTQTINGQIAIVERQDTLAAANANNLAAILNIQNVMVTEDSAWAQTVNQTLVEHSDDLALVNDKTTVLSNDQQSLANTISSVSAVANNAAADIVTERNARVSADSATASQINSLNVAVGNNASAINVERNARISADNAFANQITTVQTNVNGRIGSVETEMRTKTDNLTGQVTSIYGAKVQSGNLIGGFGIVNDGHTVEAGFDVDRFWVGKVGYGIPGGGTGAYPFWIEGSNVYMRNAFIKNGTIDSAKIGNAAITSAKIQNLEVGTIKITNGAVTAPASYFNFNGFNKLDLSFNSFGWATVVEHSTYMDYPGTVVVLFSAVVDWNNLSGLGDGPKLRAHVNGVDVSTNIYRSPQGTEQSFSAVYGVTLSGAGTVSAGLYTTRPSANPSDLLKIHKISIVLLGAKK